MELFFQNTAKGILGEKYPKSCDQNPSGSNSLKKTYRVLIKQAQDLWNILIRLWKFWLINK